MAVMTSMPSMDKPSFEPTTKPVPSSTTMALDSDINGNANQYDPLFEDPAPHSAANGDNSLAVSINGHIPAEGAASAEDLSTAPITDITSGITPTAPYLPQPSHDTDPDPLLGAGDPTTTPSLATQVQQPTSDLRDDTSSIPHTSSVQEQGTVDASTTAPEEVTRAPTSSAVDAPDSGSGDRMDVSGDTKAASLGDATAPAGESVSDVDLAPSEVTAESDAVRESIFGGGEEMVIPTSAEPTTGGEQQTNSAPAIGSVSGNDQEMMEAPSSGKRLDREEDEEETGPSAKRTKTLEMADTQPEFKVPELPTSTSATGASGQENAPAQASASSLSQTTASYDSSPMTDVQRRLLLDKVRLARKIKAAVPFNNPVDPVALNIPRYPEIIKHPMDLSTMETKLKGEQYESVDTFMSDFNLIIQNCFTFNGPGHPITALAQSLQAYFLKLMTQLPKGDVAANAAAAKKPKRPSLPAAPKVHSRRESRQSGGAARSPSNAISPQNTFALQPDGIPLIRRDSTTNDGRPKREIRHTQPRDLPYASAKPKRKKYQLELKFCETVVNEMFKPKYGAFSYPFLQPVDPVALNIPTYHKIVKKPMDLGTIKQKLKTNQYGKAQDFQQDIKLMFDNCYKFNPETDDVYKMGRSFQQLFNELWEGKDQWIADHAPPSDPQSPATTADSDDEDAESEEETDAQTARLKQIQEQIAALSGEAASLIQGATTKRSSPKAGSKKGAKAPKTSSKSKKTGGGGGANQAGKAVPPKKKGRIPILTLDQKREVSDGISQLEDSAMRKAVQIIRNGVPHLRDVNDDEMELDIDEIPNDVVYELYLFVRKQKPQSGHHQQQQDDDDIYEPPSRAAARASAGATKPRKNKPMNAQEQESKIQALREQLGRFQHGSGSEQSPEPAQQAGESSSDDDESASESEEE